MSDQDLREYFTSEDPNAEARKEFWRWLSKETSKLVLSRQMTDETRNEMIRKAYEAKTMGELLVFAEQLGLAEGDFREHLRETGYTTPRENPRRK